MTPVADPTSWFVAAAAELERLAASGDPFTAADVALLVADPEPALDDLSGAPGVLVQLLLDALEARRIRYYDEVPRPGRPTRFVGIGEGS